MFPRGGDGHAGTVGGMQGAKQLVQALPLVVHWEASSLDALWARAIDRQQFPCKAES